MGPPMRIPVATIPKAAINPISVAKSIYFISNQLVTNNSCGVDKHPQIVESL
jgi:hypothetical protein